MTRLARLLGALSLVPALLALSTNAAAQSDAFQQGVELLKRQRPDEALVEFQKVLAEDLLNEQAYELWKSADEDVWLDLLVKGGEFELFAKRVMGLAQLGRAERSRDPEAIRALVAKIKGGDAMERRTAIRTLSAEHGEFAVPYLLPMLADPNDDEGRVKAMIALAEMDTAVVPPLIAALSSDDRLMRMNVAIVLGRIQDPRAAAALTWLAATDEDPGVKAAAADAAKSCRSQGSAAQQFLQNGDDYLNARPNVLAPHDYSEVVWNWTDGKLDSTDVPRYLYAAEMAKRCYYRALTADPDSLEARAGIARSYADEQSRVDAHAAAGEDVGELGEELAKATVAIVTAGVDAVDRALQTAVRDGDARTAINLCRHLSHLASSGTAGLQAALRSGDGALRSEASIALGRIAYTNGTPPSAECVTEMGRAASREIVRIVVIIDANKSRANAIADRLRGGGVFVNSWSTGAQGLAMLNRIPGADAVLIAERLPDMTPDQVLTELASHPKYADTPKLMIAEDAEAAAEVWGDRVADVLTGAEEVEKIGTALEGSADDDRARAMQTAQLAAETLADLAHASQTPWDSGTLAALANSLTGRPDEVTVPIMRALGGAGDPASLPQLSGALADEERSEAVREAAAKAIGTILGRHPGAGGGTVAETLGRVIASDAPLAVREAAAAAMGRMSLPGKQRATVLQAMRIDAGTRS